MSTIKPGHFVRTADGTIGKVQHGIYQGIADVALIDDNWRYTGTTVELPVTELKRVPIPTPKVEGLPDVRPRCKYCDKMLAYWTTDERVKGPGAVWERVVRKVFTGWKGYGGERRGVPNFCSLNCALFFAEACVRAGYAIKRNNDETTT
jgi:hypothetical protein